MDSNPFCSVVIPALNEEEFIERCLLSLGDQTYPRDRYEIIVVDNGSIDSTRTLAEKYADKVLIKPELNVGAVRNEGAWQARGEVLICTDSDCLFERTWIENGVGLLRNHSNNVYGGGLKSGHNPTWIEKYWLLNDHGENTKQQKDLMGSCIFVWKPAFVAAGGFREDITSGEDTELSKALGYLGNKICIDKSLSVIHMGNAKTIGAFTRRQVWHAENYIKNLAQSLKDPIFYLVSAFLVLLICLPASVVMLPELFVILLILAFLLPALLSAKRIVRAKLSAYSCLKSIPLIYTLDLLYLISRSAGILKGIVNYRKSG